MKIALFTDATSNEPRKVTALAYVAFEVSGPVPRELFRHFRQIPHCNADDAELQAAYEGLSHLYGLDLSPEGVVLFTDSQSVFLASRGRVKWAGRRMELAIKIAGLTRSHRGKLVVEQIPRKLNRVTDYLAHKALNPNTLFVPTAKDRTQEILEKYPFVDVLNSSPYA